MERMEYVCDFGSGNLISRPFGIVSWLIVKMHMDAWKGLSASASTEVPFEARKNIC
jgi:hypothetical protein